MSLMKDTMTLYNMSLLFNFAIHGNLVCSSGLIASGSIVMNIAYYYHMMFNVDHALNVLICPI